MQQALRGCALAAWKAGKSQNAAALLTALCLLAPPAFAQQSNRLGGPVNSTSAPSSQLTPGSTERVSGHVLTPDGKPVPGATVRIQPAQNPPGMLVTERHTYVEIAASDGSFTAEGVAAGAYTLFATQIGYQNQLQTGEPFLPFLVGSGQTPRDVIATLTPLGLVSGTVLSYDGQPVRGAPVTLLRYTPAFGRPGPGQWLNAVGATVSDDRGQFRVLNLQPGRYILRAAPPIQPVTVQPNEVLGRSAQLSSLPTYYPSSPDMQGAMKLNVGTVPLENLQIRMLQGSTYSVRGRIEGAPEEGIITAMLTNWATSPTANTFPVTKPTGEFEAHNLPPGDYTLSVNWTPKLPDVSGNVTALPNPLRNALRAPGQSQNSPPADTPREPPMFARRDFTVTSGDVENVVVTLVRPFEIAGRFVTEDGSGWEEFSKQSGGSPIFVDSSGPNSFHTTRGPIVTLAPQTTGGNGGGVPQPSVNEQGEFLLTQVRSGEYFLNVGNLPAGTFIKEIRLGGQPLDGPVFAVTAATQLEIVVSRKTAQLQLTRPSGLSDAPPPAGHRAPLLMIWPKRANLDTMGRAQGAQVPMAGSPTTLVLPPGEYFAAILEDPPRESTDLEFLSRFNLNATSITLHAGDDQHVEPAVIPAETVRKVWEQFP